MEEFGVLGMDKIKLQKMTGWLDLSLGIAVMVVAVTVFVMVSTWGIFISILWFGLCTLFLGISSLTHIITDKIHPPWFRRFQIFISMVLVGFSLAILIVSITPLSLFVGLIVIPSWVNLGLIGFSCIHLIRGIRDVDTPKPQRILSAVISLIVLILSILVLLVWLRPLTPMEVIGLMILSVGIQTVAFLLLGVYLVAGLIVILQDMWKATVDS